MATHGVVKDAFDPRDHYYTPDPSVARPPKVNLRQDHAQLVSEIYDQLNTGSCVANATAAAYWYEEKAGRRATSWGAQGPSRLFIYWLARGAYLHPSLEMDNPRDTGTSVREAMRSLSRCGVCAEEDWPFSVADINRRPTAKAIETARPHAINRFFRLDPQRPDDNRGRLTAQQNDAIGAAVLDSLRQCLAEGYPVVFSLWYYLPSADSYDESQTPFVLKDVWSLPDKHFPRHTYTEDLPAELRIKNKQGRVITPGHAVLAIGYDDERGAVLIQNSMGAEWGGGSGTFWMPYAWITDCGATNDFWTIRATDGVGGEDAAPPKTWEEVHQEILGAC